MKRKIQFLLFMVTFIALIISCTTPTKTPFFISTEYAPMDQQRVVLLPVVDNNIHDRLDKIRAIEKTARKVIEERGYEFSTLEQMSYPANIGKNSFDKLNFDWVKTLQLEQGDWAFIISIDYLNQVPYGTGSRADAYVTGYLVEYSSGDLLWEGFGYGGMDVGFLLVTTADDSALQIGTLDLMKQFPPINAYSNIILEEPLIKGTCTINCDNPTVESIFCVFNQRSKKDKNEFEDRPGTGLEEPDLILRDGAQILTKLDGGHYYCWSKMPGKVMLHIDGGRPTHFRSKGGREYYLLAKEGGFTAYKKRIFWVFPEIKPSEREIYLINYIKINQDIINHDVVESVVKPEQSTD